MGQEVEQTLTSIADGKVLRDLDHRHLIHELLGVAPLTVGHRRVNGLRSTRAEGGAERAVRLAGTMSTRGAVVATLALLSRGEVTQLQPSIEGGGFLPPGASHPVGDIVGKADGRGCGRPRGRHCGHCPGCDPGDRSKSHGGSASRLAGWIGDQSDSKQVEQPRAEPSPQRRPVSPSRTVLTQCSQFVSRLRVIPCGWPTAGRCCLRCSLAQPTPLKYNGRTPWR